MGDRLPVVDLGTIHSRALKAKSIYGNESHVCVVTELDESKCWGLSMVGVYGLGSYFRNDQSYDDVAGLIGDGLKTTGGNMTQREMGDHLRVSDWGFSRKISVLGLSGFRICGILDGGNAVRCHGVNRKFQSSPGGGLGIGRHGVGDDRGTMDFPEENQGCYPRNTGVNGLDVLIPWSLRHASAKVIGVATSEGDHTCLVFSNMKYFCFGDNTYGAAGTGPASSGLTVESMQNIPVRTIPGN
jgi:hypothetical protein